MAQKVSSLYDFFVDSNVDFYLSIVFENANSRSIISTLDHEPHCSMTFHQFQYQFFKSLLQYSRIPIYIHFLRRSKVDNEFHQVYTLFVESQLGHTLS